MWRLAVLVALLDVAYCQHNHGEIMKDINNLHMHYNDRLCHDIQLLNCGDSDNAICGSDNVEYQSHCHFAQARCKDTSLTLLVKGPCHVLTTPSATTSMPLGGGGSTVDHTPDHSVPMKSTMAPVPASTVDPVFVIIADVFCTNAHQISCSSSPVLDICGTDGQMYKSQCMFSKVKCIKKDLEVASSPSMCAVTP